MQNPEFSLMNMADQLCMSRSSLNRKKSRASRPDAQRLSPIERLKAAHY